MIRSRICVSALVAFSQAIGVPLASAQVAAGDAGGQVIAREGPLDLGARAGRVLRLSPRGEEGGGATVTEVAPADGATGEEAAAAAGAPGEEAAAAAGAPSEQATSTAPRPTAPTPGTSELRVAVGLGEDVPGTKTERALADRLEDSMRAATTPTAEVRRLRSGAAVARRVCREGRDDLVVTVGYLPDRAPPMVFTYDCLLDRELGVRAADAASSEKLLASLWREHQEAVAAGATERRRGRLNPKVRTGLIAGGALVAIGLAVGFVLASTLRDEVTVITVSP